MSEINNLKTLQIVEASNGYIIQEVGLVLAIEGNQDDLISTILYRLGSANPDVESRDIQWSQLPARIDHLNDCVNALHLENNSLLNRLEVLQNEKANYDQLHQADLRTHQSYLDKIAALEARINDYKANYVRKIHKDDADGTTTS